MTMSRLYLYKSLVRPKLEYRIQTWNPCLQKDIDILEVKIGATSLMVKNQSVGYMGSFSV